MFSLVIYKNVRVLCDLGRCYRKLTSEMDLFLLEKYDFTISL